MTRKSARGARTGAAGGAGGYATVITSGLLVCLAAGVSLLGHIRLKAELNRLEGDVAVLERQLGERRAHNLRLSRDYETLISSAALDRRIQEMGLNLVMPGDGARVVLPEPDLDAGHPEMNAPSARSHSQLAMREREEERRIHNR
jgi:hypothetical protein